MKSKYLLPLILVLFIILSISCKEEIVVESKKEDAKTINSVLAKENISLAIVSDSLSKKEKIAKLKKEHEKPYVVINKPEKLLADKLKSRTSNKSLSKSSNNLGSYSVQSTQSCYTIEIDIWALENYISKSNYIVGIWPKGSNDQTGERYWQYNQSILSLLKNTYAFNKVGLERVAIASNTVYQANQIMALADAIHPAIIKNSYSNYYGESLWDFYTDEPVHRKYTVTNWRDSISTSRIWWKSKMGSSSVLIAGETCEGYANEYDDLVDYVNMTSYTDMISNFLVTCVEDPTDNDQRDEWTDFNNAFNNKFNHLWISGESDRGEMNQLIWHAQNMYKNSIWLYAAKLGVSDQSYWDAIYEFCYYSYMHSYINTKERKYIYVYSYTGSGDPCYDYQITSWELTDIIDSGVTRILSL